MSEDKKTQQKKSKEQLREKIDYGKNNVRNILKEKDISKVFLQKGGKFSSELEIIKQKKIPYVYVQKQYLDKLSDYGNHQGIIAISSPTKMLSLEDLINKNNNIKNPMILMLDEVQDPQNLGSIIRIVDAFNINGIIINKRRSAQITSSVAKVSTGAINYVDITRVNNLRQAIKKLKENGYFFSFLDMNGDYEVNKVNYDIPLVVIVGGEDKGVTSSIKKECDFGITINQSGHVNSLNVASATSILCYSKNISRNK